MSSDELASAMRTMKKKYPLVGGEGYSCRKHLKFYSDELDKIIKSRKPLQ